MKGLTAMNLIRRTVCTTALVLAVSGLASASTVVGYSTQFPASGTQATDFSYTLTLPKFDPVAIGQPTAVLTGVTLYFYAEESVMNLSLSNVGTDAQSDFEVLFTSNVTKNFANSANAADKYGTETLSVFDSGLISLGGAGNPACPTGTPSLSCSNVTYAPPPISHANTDDFGPTGTGVQGVFGVVKSGTSIASYIGSGTFDLTGQTGAFTSFSGGGGNIHLDQSTVANLKAEVDYTYDIPSNTPEPSTMLLLGSSLFALSFVRRRARR
jgi:hypothetical protein